jgi:hypothetical protein|nr:replication-relaxation family protein [uncultured Massilia sp.]
MKHILPGRRTTSSKTKSTRPAHPQHVERGLTKVVHASILKQKIMLRALVCLNRFRYVRAIDIAIDCFSERPFTAARHAARLAIRGLLKAGYALKYRTRRHHTIYALTAAGARRLEELSQGSVVAKSSIRAAANLTNPEHLLWANFTVLACEARGIHALTESEVMRELNSATTEISNVVQGLLKLKAHPKVTNIDADAVPKTIHLRPDALAFEDRGLVWFEIDATKRSETRLARLLALVHALGTEIPKLQGAAKSRQSHHRLAQIVVLVLEPALLARLRSLLQREVATSKQRILTEDNRQTRLTNEGTDTYALWRGAYTENGTEQIDVCVGHVVIQLAPTWLPNYQGSDPIKSLPTGWFEDNYLPYLRPPALPAWSMPVTPSDFLS